MRRRVSPHAVDLRHLPWRGATRVPPGDLTEKERRIREVVACGVLRDLHDELDRLVADAYGWPSPMETDEIRARLVALHDERVDEEKRGLVHWLRSDYQVPRFGDRVEGDLTFDVLPDEADETTPPTTSSTGPPTPSSS